MISFWLHWILFLYWLPSHLTNPELNWVAEDDKEVTQLAKARQRLWGDALGSSHKSACKVGFFSPGRLKETSCCWWKEAVWTRASPLPYPHFQPNASKASDSNCVWFTVAMQPRVWGRDSEHLYLAVAEQMPRLPWHCWGINDLGQIPLGRNYATFTWNITVPILW